jgi:PadR family transcriptional regulator, regulatory protein AphA
MDIKYAILGFLSWQPFTGYEIKKMIIDSAGFYWSGNNNQIYTSLVQLHKEDLVTSEVQPQERYPARKVYSITDAGRIELKKWVLAPPELPQLRKTFLVQLAWADQLESAELDNLLEKYESEINLHMLMLREHLRRGEHSGPARTAREKYIWEMVAENYIQSFETELIWVRQLRQGIASK